MEYTISVQPTPNPNALKFVLNVTVKTRDAVAFRHPADKAASVPLAADLLALEHVTEIFLSGNFITVTQDGFADWDALERLVKSIIEKNIPSHDPEFAGSVAIDAPVAQHEGELKKIEDILNRTIRPALQHDGGDLQLVSLEGKTLTISYQGACGCCPHAALGTLYAIQNILRDQYDPEIVVEMA